MKHPKKRSYTSWENILSLGSMQIPSDEAMVAGLTWLGSMGHVRTKTLEAWPEKEGAKILTTAHP